MTEAEMNEVIAEKEAKARAAILTIVGDLPDEDVAPPENVLFVCKLNPVTCDDDLEIIFGRFGKVIQCEVIRDRVSGESLQYAFVEFEDREACEAAYFKMDNVLIDDRRIHVDFSQSVSKYRWKGKGRLEIVGQDKAEGRKESGSRSGGASRPANNGKQQGRRDFKRRSRSPQDRKRPRSRSPEKNRYRQKSRSRSPERRRRSRDREDRERRKERQRSRSVEKNKDASSSGSSRRRRSGSRSGDERRRRSRSRDDSRGRKSSNHKRADRRSRSRSRDRHRDKR